jgi:hypothetical protein
LDRRAGRTSIDELRRRPKERNTTIARVREELRRERAGRRYEDLHRDTLGELSRLARELELPLGEEALSAAVERHAWDAVPDEAKGSGKIFRKAAPGSWGDDLAPEQVRIVERESAPIFEAFYNGTPTPLPPPDHPRVQSARARELGERVRLLLDPPDSPRASGALTYAGCIANAGLSGCIAPGHNSLGYAHGVAVSPDGTSVYVASYEADSIRSFDRAPQ